MRQSTPCSGPAGEWVGKPEQKGLQNVKEVLSIFLFKFYYIKLYVK